MTSWTIGKRIVFIVATLCALLAATGVVVWRSLTHITADAEYISADAVPGTALSAEISRLNLRNFIYVRTYLRASAEKRVTLLEQMAEISRLSVEKLKTYEATINDAEDRKLLDAVLRARAAYAEKRKEFFKLCDEGKGPEAAAVLDVELTPLLDTYVTAADKLFEYNAEKATVQSGEIATGAKSTTSLVLIITMAATGLGVLISVFVIRGTNAALTGIAAHLNSGSSETTSASREVNKSSQSLAAGASEQAASLEETSASLEEVSSMTKRNAENATQAKRIATDTRGAAERGSKSMAEMNNAMGAINDSAQKIAKIVKTIDEIAFQTNILALNAAVEAARAGEAGAGFAVVADEVRNLAQRSATAAKETAILIEESVTRSAHGVEISGQVVSSFTEILTKAREVDALVGEIANASSEQHQGISQVTTAVSQMDKVTQSNAAAAEEAAAAAEELNAQAGVLREMVGQLEKLVGSASSRANPDRVTPDTKKPKSGLAPHPGRDPLIRSVIVKSSAPAGGPIPVHAGADDAFFK